MGSIGLYGWNNNVVYGWKAYYGSKGLYRVSKRVIWGFTNLYGDLYDPQGSMGPNVWGLYVFQMNLLDFIGFKAL